MNIRSIAKRAGAIVASVALVSVAFAGSAQAAGVPNGDVPGTETNTYIRTTETVTDGGGQQFTVSVLWAETYKDNADNYRVSVPNVRINAVGVDEDVDSAGDGGIDARVRVYNGYADATTKKIQDKTWGAGDDDAADDPLNFNARNPLNRPSVTKVVVSGVGVDGDGEAGAAAVTFVQPVVGDEDPGLDGEAEAGDPDAV